VESDGQVRLAPTLAQNRSYILAVRTPYNEKLVDLIVATGETLSGASSFTTSITERQNYCGIREGRRLFVASSAEDRAVLRFLGMPVVPMGAFERLGNVEISQLQSLLREGVLPEPQQQPDLAGAGDRRASATGTVQQSVASSDALDDERDGSDDFPDTTDDDPSFVEPIRLIFVNWSPARLDTANVPTVLQMARQLRTLDSELKLGLPLYNVMLWEPSSDRLALIRSHLAHGLERDIASKLVDIDFECKLLPAGSPQFRAAGTSAPLRGPRAAAAAEWREDA
jgi:hypothetical protein